MKQKTFILTIDYEVFLGNSSGDIQSTLIDPTYRLMKILKKNNSKMTVFWDVLHYYRICQLSSSHAELLNQKKLIENQIKELVMDGHDIQLHLHPHWLDSVYQDGNWVSDYKRFSLHKLSTVKIGDDINTIYGCVSQMKTLMEDFIRPLKSDYQVTTFRAGGYLIEPFSMLRDVFAELGITIDSSVCPGAFTSVKEYNYNFRHYPALMHYTFNETPGKIDKNGLFTEYPIYTINLPLWFRLSKLIQRKFGSNIKTKFSGNGVNFETVKSNRYQGLITQIFYKGRIQLTPDGLDAPTFEFCVKRSPENAVMILHPKMLKEEVFVVLDQYINSGKMKFICLSNAVSL